MISLIDEVQLTETGLLPSLIQDYLNGSEKLKHLYGYKPQLNSFSKVLLDKSAQPINRALLVDVLKQQYASLPVSNEVVQNINLLADAKTFTVTAAHQPCLFMGPLYNFYKISGAINLAQQLKGEYPDYNFVPVFWMGSEDHDIDELNHVSVEGKEVKWEGGSGAVGRLDSSIIESALSALKAHTGENAVTAILESGLRDYHNLGKLTQYLVNELFKQHGLVVIDQDDKRLKEAFIPFIKDDVLNNRASSILRDTVDYLDSNYKAQAKPRDINFFYLGEGYRERIVFDAQENVYRVNNKAITFTRPQMESEMDSNPERFSPNVIYRPVYQEVILPNLCFIGGSGELSYWLELKPLFDYYKVNFPVLMPRNSAAIISSGVRTKMQKADLSASALFQKPENFIADRIKQQMDGQLSLEQEKRKVEQLFDEIATKAEAVDTTLKQSAFGEKQKALNALEALEGKMLKAEKRKQETFSNQVYAVHEALFPKQSLQERIESFVPFYDEHFINALVNTLNPLEFKFRFFQLEKPAN
ncbi:MAG: bacillithiol biosynthesis cysteine-adding enzyme BshC [Chitinophagales bacterium]